MEQTAFFVLIGLALVFTVLMWTRLIDPRLLVIPGLMWVLAAFGATNYEIRTDCCVTTESLWAYSAVLLLVAVLVMLYWLGAVTGQVSLDANN